MRILITDAVSALCRRCVLTALLVALALGPACVHIAQAPPARPAEEPRALLLPEELEVADLVNEYRASKGFAALRIDPPLCRAARKHSTDMARQCRLAHVL